MEVEQVLEPLVRFACADSGPEETKRWLDEHGDAQQVLGRTEYEDLLFAFESGDSDVKLRERIGALCRRLFSFESLRVRARLTCERVMKGRLDALEGLRELAQMHFEPRGDELIPLAVVGIASECDDVPPPDKYELWDPEYLKRLLAEFEAYRPVVINEVESLLALLQRPRGSD